MGRRQSLKCFLSMIISQGCSPGARTASRSDAGSGCWYSSGEPPRSMAEMFSMCFISCAELGGHRAVRDQPGHGTEPGRAAKPPRGAKGSTWGSVLQEGQGSLAGL